MIQTGFWLPRVNEAFSFSGNNGWAYHDRSYERR